jgi:organic hydroperoxide reductase OsmC/OhrA
MSTHTAEIRWEQDESDHFSLGRYTRVHEIAFDGGTALLGSASPLLVKEPFSSAAAVDPEEMFVASLASCHMLWFLDLARRAGHEIRSYRDSAVGEMAKTADGRTAITRVTLRPLVESDADPAALEKIHQQAHDACFIANSVKTEVVVEPQS